MTRRLASPSEVPAGPVPRSRDAVRELLHRALYEAADVHFLRVSTSDVDVLADALLPVVMGLLAPDRPRRPGVPSGFAAPPPPPPEP